MPATLKKGHHKGICQHCGVKLDNPLAFSCKACKAKLRSVRSKRYNDKHRTPAKKRKYNIKHKYGLDYDPVTPDSKCAVCGSTKNLQIDHDHETGKYRDILCQRCNTMVGRLEKGQDILQGCLDYITYHGGTNEIQTIFNSQASGVPNSTH